LTPRFDSSGRYETVFSNFLPLNCVRGHQRFGGTSCLHLQGNIFWESGLRSLLLMNAHGATQKKLIGHANYQPVTSELLPL
jgi:hypothetical protein